MEGHRSFYKFTKPRFAILWKILSSYIWALSGTKAVSLYFLTRDRLDMICQLFSILFLLFSVDSSLSLSNYQKQCFTQPYFNQLRILNPKILFRKVVDTFCLPPLRSICIIVLIHHLLGLIIIIYFPPLLEAWWFVQHGFQTLGLKRYSKFLSLSPYSSGLLINRLPWNLNDEMLFWHLTKIGLWIVVIFTLI